MTLQAQLTRKVGPLPVWAWGGLAAAGVLVLRAWQRAEPPTDEGMVYAGSGVGSSYGVGAPVSVPASSPPPDQGAFGENLYLSLPYGEGYLSVEGGAGSVQGILGMIPWQFPTATPGQGGGGGGIDLGGGFQPAPVTISPVATAPTSTPTPYTGIQSGPGWGTPTTSGVGAGVGPTCGPGFYVRLGAYNPTTRSYDMTCVPL